MTREEAEAKIVLVADLQCTYGRRDADERDEPPLQDLRSVFMGLGCALAAGDISSESWHVLFRHDVYRLLLVA
jgi:hypothetical protein